MLPWQQCSRLQGDAGSAENWPEQPVPKTAIKDQYCTYILICTDLNYLMFPFSYVFLFIYFLFYSLHAPDW